MFHVKHYASRLYIVLPRPLPRTFSLDTSPSHACKTRSEKVPKSWCESVVKNRRRAWHSRRKAWYSRGRVRRSRGAELSAKMQSITGFFKARLELIINRSNSIRKANNSKNKKGAYIGHKREVSGEELSRIKAIKKTRGTTKENPWRNTKESPRRNKKAMFHVKRCLFIYFLVEKTQWQKIEGASRHLSYVLGLVLRKKRAEDKKRLKRAALL